MKLFLLIAAASAGAAAVTLVGLGLSIHSLRELIMKTQQQLAADLTAVQGQITKIGAETTTTLQKVTDLEAALANGGPVSPEVEEAMNALKAQVQLVDDMVPDTTAPDTPAGDTPAGDIPTAS